MGFSFSPHFSHRWANTSKLIRQAIATELRDVIELLQPETDLNEFEFTYPDLIAHIDQLERDLQNNIDHESSHYTSRTEISRSETSNLIKPNQPSSKHQLSASQYVQHKVAQKRHLQAQNKQLENTVRDDSAVNVDDMEWVSGLEVRIDEYLSENMYKMSNELKTWLRAEIKRQLAVNHK